MSTHRLSMIAFLALALPLAGCDRKEMESGSSVGEEAPAALTVRDIDLGRTVNPDKSIGDRTDDFRPAETIYASVQTEGSGRGSLRARWTFQDGQVVDETTQEITPTGPAKTEFHVAKPDGWPVGKYRVEVLLNGNVAATKEFEVKK
jgi:hypothetical protein